MTNTTGSIRCGKCSHLHSSVAEVKACYATATTPKLAATPMALAPKLPAAKYALANLPGHANALTFFELQYGKTGTKWAGFLFVNRLVGHPGDFQKYPVKGPAKAIVLQKISANPMAAALLFSEEYSVCARCGSPLTDDESRARGLGPDCVKAFA